MEVERKVDMATILRQHDARYPIPTSVGMIVLKHLTKLDAQAVYLEIAEKDPMYHEYNKRMEELLDQADYNKGFKKEDPTYDGFDEGMRAEVQSIRMKLRKYDPFYAIKIFVEPPMPTIEHLRALSGALKNEEWTTLLDFIKKLTSRLPMERIQVDMILLAKAYGIPLTHDLTLDKLTVQQSAALEEAEKAQREAIEKDLEEKRSKGLI